MKEELLHYLFRTKQLGNEFVTTTNESIRIIDFGEHNQHDGPDFLNAKIIIDNIILSGAIEFHLKASDWILHKHNDDLNYEQVILHMVLIHDKEIYVRNNPILSVELIDKIPKGIISKYLEFGIQEKKIPCSKTIDSVNQIFIKKQLETTFFNRFLRKVNLLEKSLKSSNGDFEYMVFSGIAKYAGGSANREHFESICEQLFHIGIHKLMTNENEVYSVIQYFINHESLSQETINYYERKYQLKKINKIRFSNKQIYPGGKPIIRLNQWLSLIESKNVIFDYIANRIQLNQLIGELINNKINNNQNKLFDKVLTKSFIELILINILLPAKFLFLKMHGHSNAMVMDEYLILKKESNAIIRKWNELGVKAENAFDSQAIIELNNEWCLKKKCLFCNIGNKLLKS